MTSIADVHWLDLPHQSAAAAPAAAPRGKMHQAAPWGVLGVAVASAHVCRSAHCTGTAVGMNPQQRRWPGQSLHSTAQHSEQMPAAAAAAAAAEMSHQPTGKTVRGIS